MDNIYNPFILFDPVFVRDMMSSVGIYLGSILFGGRIYFMVLPLVIVYYLCLIPIKYFLHRE